MNFGLWQLVYFNLIIQVDFSLVSLLLKVVSMFFCALCRPSRPTCFLHGPLTTVRSAVKVRRMTSDVCAWPLLQLGQICYKRERERTTLRVREFLSNVDKSIISQR